MLAEVVEHHPVVRGLPDLIVDGARDEERILPPASPGRLRRQGEIREPDPQLIGGPEGRFRRPPSPSSFRSSLPSSGA